MEWQPLQLQRIDLNLFVVFDTLYAERSVTRAAELVTTVRSLAASPRPIS